MHHPRGNPLELGRTEMCLDWVDAPAFLGVHLRVSSGPWAALAPDPGGQQACETSETCERTCRGLVLACGVLFAAQARARRTEQRARVRGRPVPFCPTSSKRKAHRLGRVLCTQ